MVFKCFPESSHHSHLLWLCIPRKIAVGRKLELENLMFGHRAPVSPCGPGAALKPHPAARIRMLSTQIQGWPGEPDHELCQVRDQGQAEQGSIPCSSHVPGIGWVCDMSWLSFCTPSLHAYWQGSPVQGWPTRSRELSEFLAVKAL